MFQRQDQVTHDIYFLAFISISLYFLGYLKLLFVDIKVWKKSKWVRWFNISVTGASRKRLQGKGNLEQEVAVSECWSLSGTNVRSLQMSVYLMTLPLTARLICLSAQIIMGCTLLIGEVLFIFIHISSHPEITLLGSQLKPALTSQRFELVNASPKTSFRCFMLIRYRRKIVSWYFMVFFWPHVTSAYSLKSRANTNVDPKEGKRYPDHQMIN